MFTAIREATGEVLYSTSNLVNPEDLTEGVILLSEPAPGLDWLYLNGSWQAPTPSLEHLKAKRWDYIKSQRDLDESSGFIFNGFTFDSDVSSQQKISILANSSEPIEWTLKDNSTLTLSPAQMVGLRDGLAAHLVAVHNRGTLARNLLDQANTPEEIQNINY